MRRTQIRRRDWKGLLADLNDWRFGWTFFNPFGLCRGYSLSRTGRQREDAALFLTLDDLKTSIGDVQNFLCISAQLGKETMDFGAIYCTSKILQ